jgi:hypothetical protein
MPLQLHMQCKTFKQSYAVIQSIRQRDAQLYTKFTITFVSGFCPRQFVRLSLTVNELIHFSTLQTVRNFVAGVRAANAGEQADQLLLLEVVLRAVRGMSRRLQ